MNKRRVAKRERWAARFAKFVEWCDEDQCFIGRCPSLFSGVVHGDDEAEVYRELCEAEEEWIELLQKDGAACLRVNPL